MIKGETEVWKTWKTFPFIEGSTFGRIRTLDRYVADGKGGRRFVKGRVLKQYHNRNGYLQVVFNPDGHQINRSVHRIIARCFLPNPNDLPQVNHKNCIRDDNRLINLEWCSVSYNSYYREAYGIPAKEWMNRPLYAINLKTLEVFKFPSRKEASRELGVNRSNICEVLKGRYKQAGGYWFTEDDSVWVIKNDKDELRKIVTGKKPNYSVFAVSLITRKVYLFSTRSGAGRFVGSDQSTITKVINGQRNKTQNYWFTSADGNAVSNAKSNLHKLLGEKNKDLKAGDASKEVADFITGCAI